MNRTTSVLSPRNGTAIRGFMALVGITGNEVARCMGTDHKYLSDVLHGVLPLTDAYRTRLFYELGGDVLCG